MAKNKTHLVKHSKYGFVVVYCGRRLKALQKFTRIEDRVTCNACINTYKKEKEMPEQLTFLEEE